MLSGIANENSRDKPQRGVYSVGFRPPGVSKLSSGWSYQLLSVPCCAELNLAA